MVGLRREVGRRTGWWSAIVVVMVLTGRAGIALSAAPPPAPSSSPLAINIAGVVDWSTEIPFVDLFWRARAWVPQQEGQPWGKGKPLATTPQGWISSLETGQYATTVLSGPGHPAGTYTCLYKGIGELRFWGDVQNVKLLGPGRLQFSSKGTDTIFLDLRKTDPSDPVREIQVLLPECESVAADNPFHPHFLQRTAQFGVIRFMDWMDTNNSKIRAWADRPHPSDFSQAIKGVSLEYMIDLCNRLEVDPWFCIPHLADDDYVRQFATLVKARLKPGLKVYIEHSNEVWNGQFAQARHARDEGLRLKLADNEFQAQLFYHSMRSTQIFAIFEQVFGGTDRLVRVLGSQSANVWVSEQIMDFQNAYQHADALAIAPYFGHALGSPKTAREVAAMPVEAILEQCRADLERNQQTTTDTLAKAKARELVLIAYEAGQHLVGIQGAENDDALTAKLHAVNRSPGMKNLYLEYMNGWKQAGGQLMAIFSSVSAPSKWGSWGILESEFQNPATAPKYQAVLEFLKENPTPWWRQPAEEAQEAAGRR